MPGIKTEVRPAAGASPFPVLNVDWDPARYRLTGDELFELLLNGEPRIMSHASGAGHSFIIRPVSMQAGDEKLVAARLEEVFRQSAGSSVRPAVAPAVHPVGGRWDVELRFVAGSSRHTLFLEQDGNKVSGTHQGRSLKGDLAGSVDGDKVRFRSGFRMKGRRSATSSAAR